MGAAFDNPLIFLTTPMQVVQAGQFKIGLIHGHQLLPPGDIEAAAALQARSESGNAPARSKPTLHARPLCSRLQRSMDVDILVHGSHPSFRGHRYGDRFIISPGSATGKALDPKATPGSPSFVLLDIDGARCTIYSYELVGEELKVEKMVFSKDDPV